VDYKDYLSKHNNNSHGFKSIKFCIAMRNAESPIKIFAGVVEPGALFELSDKGQDKLLRSPELLAKAEELLANAKIFIENYFNTEHQKAEKIPDCGECSAEILSAKRIFNLFYKKPEANLFALANKYIRYDASMELPAWMTKRLSEQEIAIVEASAQEYWKEQYKTRLNSVSASSLNELESFVKQIDVDSPKKWSEVDFSGQLPNLKSILEGKIRQKHKQDEADRIKAEKEEKRLAEQEAKEEKLRKEQELRAAKVLAAQVNAFRKTLKIGSDTHCGPIVEIRHPMYKIAVNAQLAGFGNEAWLKVSEIFPPQFGCLNRNGLLSPNL